MFILQMHIPNTSKFKAYSSQTFSHWKEDDSFDEFNSILEHYADKIMLQMTAHEHVCDVRLTRSKSSDPVYFEPKSNDYYAVKFVAPSMSPN